MKYVNLFFSVLAVLAVLAFYPGTSIAQIYKWVDDKGVTHYGNDPYKAPDGGKKSILKDKGLTREEYNPEPRESATQDAEQKPAASSADDKGGKVEIVGGNIEIVDSPTGHALVKASLKNNLGQQARNVKLQVTYYRLRSKTPEVATIPYTGGNPAGTLNADETVKVEGEMDITQEEIKAYRYDVVWSFYNTGEQKETTP